MKFQNYFLIAFISYSNYSKGVGIKKRHLTQKILSLLEVISHILLK